MSNWIKIQTFSRLHQAELRRDILNQNGINSVIINEKDSLFLIGEIELFVEEKNEKKARALIDEFSGYTKINSFIDMKPILLFQKILQDYGIETAIKRRESSKYVLGNYELYIKNELLEKAIPFLTGDNLDGWKKLLECTKVRQTKFYIDLLAENLINSVIIKKKDSEYHLSQINIYVKEEDLDKAKKVVDKLEGFVKIMSSSKLSEIEKNEELLAKESCKSFIKKKNRSIELYVEKQNVEIANDIIAAEKEWVNVKTFGNLNNALFYKGIFESAGIPSVILNEKDRSFLLGEIDLFVEKEFEEKAKDIITNLG